MSLVAIMCLAVPMAACAEESTDTTPITGDIAPAIEVSIPQPFTMPIIPGRTNTVSDEFVFAANFDWGITVEDTKVTNRGHMVSDGYVLSHSMKVIHNGTTVDLETGGTLAYGTEHGAAITVPFTLSQYVSYSDPWWVGGYSITLAFTLWPVV